MRSSYKILCNILIYITILVSVCAAAGARTTSQIATPAPRFELPRADGGYLDSNELFPRYHHTLIVFWDSDCPHCVESLVGCEDFYLLHEGEDIALLGIHTGTGDMAEAQRLIEVNGITFPQLWDLGGEAGRDYGVVSATFSVFLVDRNGRIVDRRYDPHGDMATLLEEMLNAAAENLAVEAEGDTVSAATGEAASGRTWNGFVYRSDLRIRFMSVDSRGGLLATGPYGETVQPGNDVLYRFELEMSRRLTKHLRVGGLLRISNEDEKVLESGPQYFGVQWGSAFAELTAGGASLRLGYYSIWTTPLTLMRWDWNDNPRVGGTAGCGCGAAGILLLESLEVLGPELVFEGGVASYTGHGFETRIYYGIPRRAWTTPLPFITPGEDPAHYSLEIAGLESSWRRFAARTQSFWKVGARVAGSWEDHRSVDKYEMPWYKSAIATADCVIPVIRYVDLQGEWIFYNKKTTRGHPNLDDPIKTDAHGGLAGAAFVKPPHWNIRCDYIRLDPGFFSPFAALSYKPNREGGRVSGLFLVADEIVALSLFYKWLQQIESDQEDADKKKDTMFGASVDVELPAGVGGGVGWMRSNGPVEIKSYDELRKALVVSARWRPYKTGLLEIQYQRVEVDITGDDWSEDALTNLYSIYFSATF